MKKIEKNQTEMKFTEFERQVCEFNMYCPKLN